MLGNYLRKARERRAEARAIIETLSTPHPVFGRLDGLDEDPSNVDRIMANFAAADELSIDELPTDDEQIITFLEGQVDDLIKTNAELMEIASAASELMLTMNQINVKTGKPVFTVNNPEDDVLIGLLNHRYADLSALLCGSGRPVPAKLNEGTVH